MAENPPQPWDVVKRLLLEALAQPAEDRVAFLAEVCEGNRALYAEVESLLVHHNEAENSAFLDAAMLQQAVGETVRVTDESSRDEQESQGGNDTNSDSASEHPGVVSREDLLELFREREILVTTGSAQQVLALWNSRYEILEEIGHGGMGLVYRGRHRKLGMYVAIKMLNPGGSEDRFLREARILAQIKSPHVVRIHDFEVLDGRLPVLVMEWIEGRNLHQMMLDFGGRVPEAYALRWMRDVCEGMLAADAEGIIHRDLKPSNILIDGRNRARVADFGLARNPATADAMSKTGNVMGTAYYMSPEQAEDPRGVDKRADIYSFGATFYHVLTGEPPFSGETAFTILFKHKTEPLISPRARFPGMSKRTSSILERCLAKSPADRFDSFAALLRQLESPSAETSLWNTTDDQDFAQYISQYRARRESYFNFPRSADMMDVYEFPDGRTIRILVGNLVEQDVDVIVSSDTAHLWMSGGVSESIKVAGGEQIYSDAQSFAPVRPGRAIVTRAGNLPARFVFHGVTMGFNRDRLLLPSPDIISEILASCFYHADTLDVSSIAFPLLGTGAGGFPNDVCLDTLFRFLARTFSRGMTSVREARVVLLPGNAQRSRSVGSDATSLMERIPTVPGYSLFHHHKPAIRSAGDYYDCLSRDDDRAAIVIADPGGSGFETALWTRHLSVELRNLFQSDSDPANLLQQLNSWHCSARPHRSITMVIAVLDPRTHRIDLANAGHMAPLIRLSDGRVEHCSSEASGLPLGILTDTEYERQHLSLGQGDLFVLYTDGLSEAMNEQSEIYGLNRLQRVISAAGPNPTIVGQKIVADVEHFIGLRAPMDDCTFLIVGRE